MTAMYDYKLYCDNAGNYHLFVRDYYTARLIGGDPTLYCFSSGDRRELVNALGDILSCPEDAALAEWSGWGDCDDPEAALSELDAIIAERNGGAYLVAEGDVYDG